MAPGTATENQPKSHLIIVGFIAAMLIGFAASDFALQDLFPFIPIFLIDAVIAASVIAGTMCVCFRHGPTSFLTLTVCLVGLLIATGVLRIIALTVDGGITASLFTAR